MATSGIYKILNKLNGMFYVGRSKNIEKRFNSHKSALRRNIHHSVYLQRAWNKYGEENFDFIIEKEIFDENEMIEFEQYYLDKLKDKLYNTGELATDGGDLISNHPDKAKIIAKMKNTLKVTISNFSEEERKKKYAKFGESNGMFGRGHTLESRKKMSRIVKENMNGQDIFNKGKKIEDITSPERAKEVREMLSKLASERTGEKNPFYGKHHSEETKQKLSKKIKELELGKKKYKIVIIDGVEYESLTAAAKACDITLGAMHNRIKSKNPLYSGYFYKEELENKNDSPNT